MNGSATSEFNKECMSLRQEIFQKVPTLQAYDATNRTMNLPIPTAT